MCLVAEIARYCHRIQRRAEAGFPLIGNDFSRLVNRIRVPQALPEKTGRPVILMIGRLLPVKRPWVYFEIAKRLPDYEFLVVGEMDYRKHLKQIVEEAKAIPNLKFPFHRARRSNHEWTRMNTNIKKQNYSCEFVSIRGSNALERPSHAQQPRIS